MLVNSTDNTMPENRIMHFQRLCLHIYVSANTQCVQCVQCVYVFLPCISSLVHRHTHAHPEHTNCAIAMVKYDISVFDCRSVSFTFIKVTCNLLENRLYCYYFRFFSLYCFIPFFRRRRVRFSLRSFPFHLKYSSPSVKLHCKLIYTVIHM